MNNLICRNSWLLAAVALGLVCDAAVWADTAPEPLATVKQVGATAVVYKGPDVNLALSYRFPENNPEGKWLLLQTVMTASAAPVEVPRSAISLRTPDGRVVPLATQVAFGEAYPELASSVMRASVFREPLGYLIPERSRRMDFFSVPGRHLAFDSVWLDQWHNSYGPLYFELPGGLHRGDYALLIDLPNGTVTVPFTI